MYPSPLAPPAPTLHATNLQPSSGSGNVSASNRPGTPSAGGASSVRVEISSSYRSDPPVPLTSIEAIPDNSNLQFDFEYERNVVRRAVNPASDEDSLEELMGESMRGQDPFAAAIEQYKAMGLDKEAVSMAVGMYGFDSSTQNQVLEFCNHYERIKEMGYPPQTIAGALFMNKNNVQAAIEQLMTSST